MVTAEERLLAYRRTVVIIAAVIFLVLAFMIIRPFLVAAISAAVLAYLFYPVYKSLTNYIPAPLPKETLAAMITCVLIILIVLIPVITITVLLTQEVRSGYLFLQQMIGSPEFRFELPPVISQYLGDISQYKDQIANFGMQLIGWLQDVIKGIPNVILNIFVAIFSIYFFLKGGRNIYLFLEDFFPLPAGRYKQIFTRFDDLSRGMILGQMAVGAIQGVLAWLGFVILRVPNPVLWGFLTGIISIIPLLGAALVWFPIAVYLFIRGLMVGTYWRGVVLLVYGMFVVSTIDNILKPKIVGERARVHPLIVLFGILGGIQLVGIPGILIGPLVLTLFDVVMEIFREVV